MYLQALLSNEVPPAEHVAMSPVPGDVVTVSWIPWCAPVRGTPKFQYSNSATLVTLCDHPPKKSHQVATPIDHPVHVTYCLPLPCHSPFYFCALLLPSYSISISFHILFPILSTLISLPWSTAGCYALCSFCSPPLLGKSLEFFLWIPLARIWVLCSIVRLPLQHPFLSWQSCFKSIPTRLNHWTGSFFKPAWLFQVGSKFSNWEWGFFFVKVSSLGCLTNLFMWCLLKTSVFILPCWHSQNLVQFTMKTNILLPTSFLDSTGSSWHHNGMTRSGALILQNPSQVQLASAIAAIYVLRG